MNFEKGLFRLWVLGSVAYAFVIFIIYLPELKTEMSHISESKASASVIPQLSTSDLQAFNAGNVQAMSDVGLGIVTGIIAPPPPGYKLDTPAPSPSGPWTKYQQRQEVKMPDGKILSFPANMSDEQIRRFIVLKFPQAAWDALFDSTFSMIIRTILPSLFLLCFGKGLIWAIKGFRTPRNAEKAQP
jgi:hypothetical protein